MFETSTGLGWSDMAGLVLLPHPLKFIPNSWGSTKKYIRISLLVSKLFPVLRFECLLLEQK